MDARFEHNTTFHATRAFVRNTWPWQMAELCLPPELQVATKMTGTPLPPQGCRSKALWAPAGELSFVVPLSAVRPGVVLPVHIQ